MIHLLVHGAWAGGWAWSRLADRLIRKGHRVHVPTLTGLGERSHLASFDVNLSPHVQDIVNEILWKASSEVVLVGASYGGMVITGAAERIGERIAAMCYVDAFIPADGQSFADITGWHPTDKMTAPPEMPRDGFATEADYAWVVRRSPTQPSATLTERLKVTGTGAYQRVPKSVYSKS